MRCPMMLKGSVAAKRSQPFRHIVFAPRDGTLIEVRHGPDQGIVLARWAGQNQAFTVTTIRYAGRCIASRGGVQQSAGSRAGAAQ
jgi:hypothetical protein